MLQVAAQDIEPLGLVLESECARMSSMTSRERIKMWNRVSGPKGFDTDSTLPYRERLIVCYFHEGRMGIGEAYVDDGVWYWWDNTQTNCKVKINESYELNLWTIFPHDMMGA